MYAPSPQMVADTKRREGFSLSVYKDSKGLATQGYGRHTGVSFGDADITEEIAEQWLLKDLQNASTDALELFPELDTLDLIRKETLIDLVYNMGQETLSEFTPFITAVNNQDWIEAPWHLMTNLHGHLTPYLMETGARAVDNALRLSTGEVLREFRV